MNDYIVYTVYNDVITKLCSALQYWRVYASVCSCPAEIVISANHSLVCLIASDVRKQDESEVSF